MLALAALLVSVHGGGALAQADAIRWQTPARTSNAAAARRPATRLKALEQVVRRLDPDDQPSSYASSGPSGL